MYEISMSEASSEFAECWKAAGIHIQNQAQGGLRGWLKADLNSPFLEHLSFRLGNQLFFIRIIDVDGQIETPGNSEGLKMIAEACKGHACFMPLKKVNGQWIAIERGWGLINAESIEINPVELITDERIVMTDWELQDFAVQIVRDSLVKQGKELTSWHGNPAVHPSLWFVGDTGLEWVVVKAARWPERECEIPENINEIADRVKRIGQKGHFALVKVASANDPFDPMAKTNGNFIQLYRGEQLSASYQGLSDL
jgi:hypothetical protein